MCSDAPTRCGTDCKFSVDPVARFYLDGIREMYGWPAIAIFLLFSTGIASLITIFCGELVSPTENDDDL